MRPPTPPLPEQARVNTGDLRSQLVKRVGLERAERYFRFLGRLLSDKLSKPEFNKLCLVTLGRENLPLHNQVIHSILKNAVGAKAPPPPQAAAKFNSSLASAANQPRVGWANGGLLPPSPRKRSGVRRISDQQIPFPIARENSVPLPPLLHHGEDRAIMENGDFGLYDSKTKRPPQHQQGGPIDQPAKPVWMEKMSSHELASARSKNPVEVGRFNSSRFPLRAPLGIPFCPASVGGAQMPLPLPASSGVGGNYVGSELSHSEVISRRIETIVQAQGLGGVTMDGANLLKKGLDAYLKGLIRSSVELVGVKSGEGQVMQQQVYKKQPHIKPVNGVWSGNHMHVQNSVELMEGMAKSRNQFAMSLQDFRVAMELNPRQLGEDWPLLLEKICVSSFEE